MDIGWDLQFEWWKTIGIKIFSISKIREVQSYLVSPRYVMFIKVNDECGLKIWKVASIDISGQYHNNLGDIHSTVTFLGPLI